MAATGAVKARDVCEIVGISYRQLDHWCRKGYLSPVKGTMGTGDPRRFSAEDVRLLKKVARRVKMGWMVAAAFEDARR